MNTIINVSNIIFRKKNEPLSSGNYLEESDGIKLNESNINLAYLEKDSQQLGNKPHSTIRDKVNDGKNVTIGDDLYRDESNGIESVSLKRKTMRVSLSGLFYKVSYEIIVFLFYVVLSPAYFFDTYTVNFCKEKNEKASILDLSSAVESNEKLFFPKKLIPQSVLTKRKILILDLDETLIHSTNISEDNSATVRSNSIVGDKNKRESFNSMSRNNNKVDSFQTEVSFKLPKNSQIPAIFTRNSNINDSNSSNDTNNQKRRSQTTEITSIYNILQRPHLIQFLKTCNIWYDMIIYTASLREYSEPIINQLEYMANVRFVRRFYRGDCKVCSSGYVKPVDYVLRSLQLGNNDSIEGLTLRGYNNFKNDAASSSNKTNDFLGKPLGKESVIILDNMAVSFMEDCNNGIEIESWYGDSSDIELLKLLPLLEGLRNVADVRRVLSLSQGDIL